MNFVSRASSPARRTRGYESNQCCTNKRRSSITTTAATPANASFPHHPKWKDYWDRCGESFWNFFLMLCFDKLKLISNFVCVVLCGYWNTLANFFLVHVIKARSKILLWWANAPTHNYFCALFMVVWSFRVKDIIWIWFWSNISLLCYNLAR